MRLQQLGGKGLNDPLMGTAPIFKIDLKRGSAHLIGTGFWVTTHGHLITAWHVIQDNIGKDGVDEGPICAIQTLHDRTLLVRYLRKTDRHGKFDLALSETTPPLGDKGPLTVPHMLTLDEPTGGSRVHTHSYLAPNQNFSGERHPGVSTFVFRGNGTIPEIGLTFDVSYMARVGHGIVTEHFPDGRDAVMLPFPCFQSDMPIYGANSGGPVFDEKGRVCGINCTSYEGSDISFHVPLKGALELWARNIEFIPEDPVARQRSILELGLAKRVPFDPPLSKVFFPLYMRMLLWPYHRVLRWRDQLRWTLYQTLLKAAAEAEKIRNSR